MQTFKVIGYNDKSDMAYVNSNFVTKYENEDKSIFSIALFSSKNKNIKQIYTQADETKIFYRINSSYTYGLGEVASFLDNYSELFMIVMVVALVLVVGFTILSAYIILKQKRQDILILRGIGMDKKTISFTYIFSIILLGIVQIIISMLVYAIAIHAINLLIRNASIVAFYTLFFEGIFTCLASLGMLSIGVLFVIKYLSVLFKKSINYRKKQI